MQRGSVQWPAIFLLRVVDEVLADVEAVLVACGIGVFGRETVADGDDGEVGVVGVVFQHQVLQRKKHQNQSTPLTGDLLSSFATADRTTQNS